MTSRGGLSMLKVQRLRLPVSVRRLPVPDCQLLPKRILCAWIMRRVWHPYVRSSSARVLYCFFACWRLDVISYTPALSSHICSYMCNIYYFAYYFGKHNFLCFQRLCVRVMTATLWIRTRVNALLSTFAPMDVLSVRMVALATQLEPDVAVPLATRAPTAKLVSALTRMLWLHLFWLHQFYVLSVLKANDPTSTRKCGSLMLSHRRSFTAL